MAKRQFAGGSSESHYRNYAQLGQCVVLWNLALDQNHAPHLGGCTDCRGVVTIDHSKSPAAVTPTVDFTGLAHASNFVAPRVLFALIPSHLGNRRLNMLPSVI